MSDSLRRRPSALLAAILSFGWLLCLTIIIGGALGAASEAESRWYLGLATLALSVLPMLMFAAGKHREAVPLLPLNGLFYAASFALPTLADPPAPFALSEYGLTSAVQHACLGLVALYVGYYVVAPLFASQVRPIRVLYRVSPHRMIRLALVFEGGFLVWRTLVSPTGIQLASLDQMLPSLGILGKAILLEGLMRGQLPRPTGAVVLWVILPAELVIGLASGSLAQPMTTLFLVSLVYFRVRRRVPLGALAAVPALLVLLQPVKNEFRLQTWYEGNNQSVVEKTLLFLRLAGSFPGISGMDQSQTGFTAVLQRVDQRALLAFVIEKTPRVIPYAHGATILPIFYWWVPRVLWAGKPRATIGHDWGQTYGILAPDDDTTSVNLPWLCELYMNFGTLGVLFGMFIIGIVLRLLVRLLCTEPLHSLDFANAVSLMLVLWWSESNIATMLGGLATRGIVQYVILRVALRPRRTPRPGTAPRGVPAVAR